MITKSLVSMAYCEGVNDAIKILQREMRQGVSVEDAIIVIRNMVLDVIAKEKERLNEKKIPC